MKLLDIADTLVADLKPLRFSPPVAYVYNPLEYAREAHAEYVRRYGRGRREIVLLGMNPGPWGMVQTGVPFGEVGLVRDWLGIGKPAGKRTVSVGKPKRAHPKRPVTGFACTRSEVSGARLWGWARDSFGAPEHFFERFFVANYCPLTFMEETGRNRTPDKLPAGEREPVFDACDKALRATVKGFQPRIVIGIGAFAEKRAAAALDGMDVTVGRILHPSPASPAANRGWAARATTELADHGIVVGGSR